MDRIDIKTSYSCNNNCLFCVVRDMERNRKALSVGQIEDELVNARKTGAYEVAFTGGEPTIREELPHLLDLAGKLGFQTAMVITNGRVLSDLDYAKKIFAAGANKFMFSIHGENKAHDMLTRAKNSFEQSIKGMHNIRQLGVKFVTDTVAVKPNLNLLPTLIDQLITFGSEACQIDFVIPCGNAWANRDLVVPRLSDAVPKIQEAIEEQKKKGKDKKVIVMGVPPCFMQGYESYLNEPKIPVIKIISPKKSHSTADYSLHRQNAKTKPGICAVCKHFSNCEGLWQGYVQMYGISEIVPVK